MDRERDRGDMYALVGERRGHWGRFSLVRTGKWCIWVSRRFPVVETAANVLIVFVWTFLAGIKHYRRCVARYLNVRHFQCMNMLPLTMHLHHRSYIECMTMIYQRNISESDPTREVVCSTAFA